MFVRKLMYTQYKVKLNIGVEASSYVYLVFDCDFNMVQVWYRHFMKQDLMSHFVCILTVLANIKIK